MTNNQKAWAAYDKAEQEFRAAMARNDFEAADIALADKKAAFDSLDLEAYARETEKRRAEEARAEADAKAAEWWAGVLGDAGAVEVADDADGDDYW